MQPPTRNALNEDAMDRGMKAAELATAADVARSYVFGGSLRWVGEHRVCALKRQGDEETARVSLYHTHASAAGEGVVALAETFITPA